MCISPRNFALFMPHLVRPGHGCCGNWGAKVQVGFASARNENFVTSRILK